MTNVLPDDYVFVPFTREEEHELFIRYREENDEVAKEQLCLSVMRMLRQQIYTSVRHYQGNAAELLYEDILSNCMISLLRCLEAFDYKRQIRFSTYVNWAITNRIRTFFSNKKRGEAYGERSNSAVDTKRGGNGTRIAARRRMDSRQHSQNGINEDALPAYHIVDRRQDTIVLLDLLKDDFNILDNRSQEVFRLKFIEGKSNKEIAGIFDLSKVRIEQILDRGARKVREKSCNRKIYLQAVAS